MTNNNRKLALGLSGILLLSAAGGASAQGLTNVLSGVTAGITGNVTNPTDTLSLTGITTLIPGIPALSLPSLATLPLTVLAIPATLPLSTVTGLVTPVLSLVSTAPGLLSDLPLSSLPTLPALPVL